MRQYIYIYTSRELPSIIYSWTYDMYTTFTDVQYYRTSFLILVIYISAYSCYIHDAYSCYIHDAYSCYIHDAYYMYIQGLCKVYRQLSDVIDYEERYEYIYIPTKYTVHIPSHIHAYSYSLTHTHTNNSFILLFSRVYTYTYTCIQYEGGHDLHQGRVLRAAGPVPVNSHPYIHRHTHTSIRRIIYYTTCIQYTHT